jgi:hypothetical protein
MDYPPAEQGYTEFSYLVSVSLEVSITKFVALYRNTSLHALFIIPDQVRSC